MKPPEEVLERLPEEVQRFIHASGQPKSGRTPTLTWLAFECAKAGLTNNEIALVISYRDSLWGPKPKYRDDLPYSKWREIIRMVDKAREEYPAIEQGRYTHSPSDAAPDTWLSID